MKKTFLTLAVVFITALGMTSCGGDTYYCYEIRTVEGTDYVYETSAGVDIYKKQLDKLNIAYTVKKVKKSREECDDRVR